MISSILNNVIPRLEDNITYPAEQKLYAVLGFPDHDWEWPNNYPHDAISRNISAVLELGI